LIGHFSAEELASYRAGAIDADRAARISAHLADCARCADVDSDLAEVSALLARVPAPPMPDRLTERVQAAISAESERRAAHGLAGARVTAPAEPGGPVNVPGRSDRPDRAGRARRRRARSRRSFWTSPLVLRGLAATGVFAFIVIGAAIALHHVGVRGAASAPNAGHPAYPKVAPSAAPRYPGYSGSNNALSTPAGVNVSYHRRAHEATARVLATNRHYTRGNLARIVRSDIIGSTAFPTAGGAVEPVPAITKKTPEPPRAPETVGSVSVVRIAGCLSVLAPRNGVLVVEIAHYQGKPAMIIVGRPVGNFYRVTVAGLACSASGPDVLARITVPKAR
jgi:hypothetical protein